MRHRRCLVPADGFYEWKDARGSKQPHFIRMNDSRLFAFTGLSETCLGADGSEIEAMAILTTGANGDMARIHDRMPVIIETRDFGHWLDCSSGSAEGVKDLLAPLPDGRLTITAVSPTLNNPRAEGPELQQSSQPNLL